MSVQHREDTTATVPAADNCGSPDDGKGFYLWLQVQKCSPSSPNPCVSCDQRTAVMNGGSPDHYLLVARDRVKGIECEKVTSGTDYWLAAANEIHNFFKATNGVGLGINSQSARQEEQLHIHMALFVPQAQADLELKKDSIPYGWDGWKGETMLVRGRDETAPHNYRVMKTSQLTTNLFAQLRKHVVPADRMSLQTMILIPRLKETGFYVLNSEADLPSLRNGTSTCDHLLIDS
ncbi:CDP-diacylglycerol diphosphatase [Streptomyces sp. NPDC102274]|uniref:CDP-diacylglycerol diphosphatase n=1 Tax=Streptomyces sp. NPDC102274 TaxID=3366151 RepID=UPI003827E2DE